MNATRPRLRVPERDILASVLDYLAVRRDVAMFWRANSGAMKQGDEIQKRYVPFAYGRDAKGMSDVCGMLDGGTFFAIETKAFGKKPTKDQQEFLDKVRSGGGLAIVARSIDDVVAGMPAVVMVARGRR